MEMRFKKNFHTQSYRQIFNIWNYSHLVGQPLFYVNRIAGRVALASFVCAEWFDAWHCELGMFWKWTSFSPCFSWDCCILFQSQFCSDDMQMISYNTIVGGPDFECLYRSISHHSLGYLFIISLTKAFWEKKMTNILKKDKQYKCTS